MKNIAFLIIVIVAMVAAVACVNDSEASRATPTISADNKNVEQTIVNLEHEWVAAILVKDTATLDRLLAEDFVGTTNDLRYFKTDAIEDVKKGNHELLKIDNLDVRVYGDAAVVTMDQEEKSFHNINDFSGTYLFTDIWVKQNGTWRAVGSHGSRIR